MNKQSIFKDWKDLIDRLPGGVGIYYIYPDNRVELEYLNDTFYAIMDSSREERQAYTGFDTFDSVYPSDRTALVSELRRAIWENIEIQMDIRVRMKDDSYRWLNVRARVAKALADKTAMYLLFTDVDEAHHNQILAEESRMVVRVASQNGDMALWVYHLNSGRISQSFANQNNYGYPLEIPGGPEAVIAEGGIHSEDIEQYRQLYRNIDNGEERSEATIRMKVYKPEERYEWRRVILTRQEVAEEAPIAIGLSINVDLQKEAEIRYERENRLRQELVKDAVVYYRINLSNGMVEELYSEAMDTSDIQFPISMQALIEKGLFLGCYRADYPLLSSRLNVEQMRRNYEDGKSTESFSYRRYIPGKGIRWLKASIAKLKRVSSDDVIAFFTAVDIDEEKKEQKLLRDVIDEEIESLIIMRVETKQIRVIMENRKLNGYDPACPNTGYISLSKEFRASLFENMLEEDQEAASDFITTEHVVESLKNQSVLQTTYRIRTKGGEIRRKKVRVFYLDETKEDIIFARRDITDLYNEQKRQSAALKQAMDEARSANEAKSKFLSRMSHDMRTPLNAIIGYSGEVLREGATEAQKDEFLDDIHYSGEYLLGIINDVLDMTKIESNKMVLHPEPYAWEEFRERMETVIRPLCVKKGIHFELTLLDDIQIPVMLDKVRFNQIFVNILSNAVKFTPAGGKIMLKAECLKKTKRLMDMSFSVADNGCGMSEEFLPHAFDSFSQEYEGQAMHKEQGTGLGLSIVKQLVELMGGTISVESRLSKGTTFTVQMPVALSDTQQVDHQQEFPKNGLMGMQILLCEDHPMNSKMARRMLEKEGCSVDVAENGAIGVGMFKESLRHHYDAVLMDIQMPVMDGLQAARAIRALDREDAGTVPIIAMTANAFVEDRRDAIEAGMNAHIAKPIDTNEMYWTIYKYVSNRHILRTPKILIVDDIEMNAALVARVLKDQYETVIALSGAQALEVLKKNPYIIAVITDVQMPEMDGGELIRRIRQNPAYNHIALIANTAFGDSHIEDEMIKDGADDFIYKPTGPSVILSRVHNVLAKYR